MWMNNEYGAVQKFCLQLKAKLGNRNSCILSKDRYAAYRGTNLPFSPFDCHATRK